MDHLIYGPDLKLRAETFRTLRAKIFATPDAAQLDSEALDAHKLSPEKLKIALISLPSVSSRRLVHISRAEKLEKQNIELLSDFLKKPHPHVVLVLEAEVWDESAKMRQGLGALFTKVGSAAASGPTVFNMMDGVIAGNSSGALRMLKSLFDSGEEPEKLIGGVLWSWSNKAKGRVPVAVYKKGLLFLQEADLALKRSRFPDRTNGLEILVVKLSLLMQRSRA